MDGLDFGRIGPDGKDTEDYCGFLAVPAGSTADGGIDLRVSLGMLVARGSPEAKQEPLKHKRCLGRKAVLLMILDICAPYWGHCSALCGTMVSISGWISELITFYTIC